MIFSAKYPEIKSLFGPDPYMKYLVPLIVIFQLVTAYYVIQLPGPAIFFLSWALAGNVILVLYIEYIFNTLCTLSTCVIHSVH